MNLVLIETSGNQAFTATLNHRFNDAWSVRNITRWYDYELDRYNTLPGGTTDPAKRKRAATLFVSAGLPVEAQAYLPQIGRAHV